MNGRNILKFPHLWDTKHWKNRFNAPLWWNKNIFFFSGFLPVQDHSEEWWQIYVLQRLLVPGFLHSFWQMFEKKKLWRQFIKILASILWRLEFRLYCKCFFFRETVAPWHTVWKFQDFSVNQILCEINLKILWVQKLSFLQFERPWILFWSNNSPTKSAKMRQNWILGAQKRQN